MTKVSVIMPVFNAENYLSIALDSLVCQTLKDIEIICVDDGSTDESAQILEAYQRNDSRIIILRQENLFAGAARNYGLSVAKGKYLSFLDADDYFMPTMLEKAYQNAEMQNADVVIFGGKSFKDDIKNSNSYPALLREDQIPAGIGFDNVEKIENLMTITTPAPWNKLFLRTFIERHHLEFQTCKRVNDAYFVEMSLACAERIGIVRENLIYYRTGNSNSLQGTNNESPTLFALVFISIQDKLKELHIYEKVKKSFKNLCLANCIYNLESITDADAFEKLYIALQTNIFHEFGLEENNPENYYNRYAYDMYCYIRSHSPIQYWMYRYNQKLKDAGCKQYLFPYQMVPKGSRIIIYGGGKVGQAFYKQIKKSRYCDLAAWVDRSVREYEDQVLCAPQNAEWDKCDYIIIAIEAEETAKSIRKELYEKYNIYDHKIVWTNPSV